MQPDSETLRVPSTRGSHQQEDIPNQYGGWRVWTEGGSLFSTYQDSFISGLYQTALQRSPSQFEVNYWSSPIPNNGFNCAVHARWRTEFFLKAHEFKTSLPINSANAQRRVRRLYWSAFNRPADTSGLNYWTSAVVNGGEATWDWMVSYFVYSVIAESNPRFMGIVNAERGPCITCRCGRSGVKPGRRHR